MPGVRVRILGGVGTLARGAEGAGARALEALGPSGAALLVLVLDKPRRTGYGRTSRGDSEVVTQGGDCHRA